MKRQAWKSQVRALGLPGLCAALALLLAAGLAWQGQRWEREAAADAALTERLRAEARQLRASAPAGWAAAASAAELPSTPEQWRQTLPPASQRQQRLADLLEMGLRLGLVSTRTEHRLSVDAASGLERLRIIMPLTGGYAQLRQYIEAALRHDPALSLDSLKLRRASPQAVELEAELQWSLHGRLAAAAGEATR